MRLYSIVSSSSRNSVRPYVRPSGDGGINHFSHPKKLLALGDSRAAFDPDCWYFLLHTLSSSIKLTPLFEITFFGKIVVTQTAVARGRGFSRVNFLGIDKDPHYRSTYWQIKCSVWVPSFYYLSGPIPYFSLSGFPLPTIGTYGITKDRPPNASSEGRPIARSHLWAIKNRRRAAICIPPPGGA